MQEDDHRRLSDLSRLLCSRVVAYNIGGESKHAIGEAARSLPKLQTQQSFISLIAVIYCIIILVSFSPCIHVMAFSPATLRFFFIRRSLRLPHNTRNPTSKVFGKPLYPVREAMMASHQLLYMKKRKMEVDS